MSNYFYKLTLLLFFITKIGSAQESKFFVQFSDKSNTIYNVNNPSLFLSQKAIERRKTQKIAITEHDFPVNKSFVNAISQFTGVKIVYTSKWLNGVLISLVDTSVLAQINQLPFVVSHTKAARIAKPIRHIEKYNLHKKSILEVYTPQDYGQGYDQISQLNGEKLHSKGYQGNNVLIGIFDAGFNNANNMFSFDHIRQRNGVITAYDFVDSDTNPYKGSNHGTFVWGCMGGLLPGTFIGTAPQANFALFRTENEATELVIEEYNWVAAAEFADSMGVDVVNSSLIYTQFDDPQMNYTYQDMNGKTAVISRAANWLVQKGVVVCNSAGNYGAGFWKYIGAPADADSILTVGAVDAAGDLAGFSSVGPTSDGRIKPDVVARGASSVTTNLNGSGVAYVSGTSFSSPITAGMMACLRQALPKLSAFDLIQLVKKSANRASSPDNAYGFGIPNFDIALKEGLKSNLLQTLPIDGLLLYPNPTINGQMFLGIKSRIGVEYQISIHNVLGQEVSKISINNVFDSQIIIDLSEKTSLKKGCYIITVRSENNSQTLKAIFN